jgi:hypothetical protein
MLPVDEYPARLFSSMDYIAKRLAPFIGKGLILAEDYKSLVGQGILTGIRARLSPD